ncbi:MAG: glycosyltransferase family 39 protein [Tepidisphaeraceae bacterium]|jgi:hypothetical protein
MTRTITTTETRRTFRPWLRQFVVVGLLIFGVELWLTVMHARHGRDYQIKILGVAVLFSLIWPLNKWIDAAITRCDAALARRPGRVALFVGVAMFLYLYFQPVDPGELYLKFHDEHSYMIQAHMLARGRLWMPAYPLQIAPFFDNFHIIVDRVYASIYFPGTALLMTPGIWLDLPFWAMPTLGATAAAVFFYLIVQEILGPVRALLAVLMLAAIFYFHQQAQMVLSEIPFLLGAMILTWSWLRWRKRQNWKWMIPLGAAAGYCAITRPMDALCYAIPVAVAILIELRPPKLPRLLPIAAAAIAAAGPFLALQIIQNIGVTGNWHTFPSDYYVARNYPAPMLGFHHFDPSAVPVSACAPKEQAMQEWIIGAYQLHTVSNLPVDWIPLPKNLWQPERLYTLFLSSLPNPMMLVLIPCGLLSLRDLRRRVLIATLPLFILGYAAYVFFLAHYMVAIMPAMILLILCGWETLARVWPGARPVLVTMMLTTLAGLSIGALPQIDRYHDWMPVFPETRYANEQLALLEQKPTLVLFRFDPNRCSYHDEPAYNDTVAFPDEAMIIRARDLGPKEDQKLFAYYAQRQPDRVVYLYDRGAIGENRRPLTRLGTVRQLFDGN